ncbi:MAG: hypothetical protein FJ116_07100 [Deltaproteobacteria bacterium]|nr:hypothetical protein [Deltaproteobacteria bacterium]
MYAQLRLLHFPPWQVSPEQQSPFEEQEPEAETQLSANLHFEPLQLRPSQQSELLVQDTFWVLHAGGTTHFLPKQLKPEQHSGLELQEEFSGVQLGLHIAETPSPAGVLLQGSTRAAA